MLATDFDSNLGGRDFDKVLMDYFQQDFKSKYNLDAYSNIRAKLRLLAECEKVKKIMSTNSSVIPLNIECFLNDKDVSSKIKREDFEALAENLLNRFKNLLANLLKEASECFFLFF
jgi:molecular chaperone DnaK (HSP70)